MIQYLNMQKSLEVINYLYLLSRNKPTRLECSFGSSTTHVTLEIVAKYEKLNTQTVIMGVCPIQLVNDFNTHLLQLWLNSTTEFWKSILAQEYILAKSLEKAEIEGDHYMMLHTIFNQKQKSMA